MRAAISIISPLLVVLLLAAACDTIATPASVDAQLQADFALGRDLRARCRKTGDPSDCLEWRNYKRSIEASSMFPYDFDKGLDRWIASGGGAPSKS